MLPLFLRVIIRIQQDDPAAGQICHILSAGYVWLAEQEQKVKQMKIGLSPLRARRGRTTCSIPYRTI
ncbi:hypothetical protein D4759_10605 [Clostridiales bacterium AHG0011]|nr:hypothetical protein [Clostridiales bacterium AHG0011]